MKDLTNASLFRSDGSVSQKEMAELKTLAGEMGGTVAGEVLNQFEAFAEVKETTSFFGAIGNFFKSLFGDAKSFVAPSAEESDRRVADRDYRSSRFDPTSVSLPPPGSATPTSGVGLPSLTGQGSDTYVSQFGDVARAQRGEIPGSAAVHNRESQANCGVASAAMISRMFGGNPPDMHTMRQEIGARVSQNGGEGGAFAISTDQLGAAVSKYAGRPVTSSTHNLPGSASAAIQDIAQRLNNGEKVVLLTGGFGGSVGHYTVIKGVNPDGSFIVDDPARGPNVRVTADQLQRAMDVRSAAGRANQIMSFKEA